MKRRDPATRARGQEVGAYGHAVDRPLLILNPRHDHRFVTRAQYLIAAGTGLPERLQELLRKEFPRAVVRPRALSGEPQPVWYVYREGHWVSGAED